MPRWHFLVPVDGGPTFERGFQEAIQLARLTGGQLRLLCGGRPLLCVDINACAGYAGNWPNLLRDAGDAPVGRAAAPRRSPEVAEAAADTPLRVHLPSGALAMDSTGRCLLGDCAARSTRACPPGGACARHRAGAAHRATAAAAPVLLMSGFSQEMVGASPARELLRMRYTRDALERAMVRVLHAAL